MLTKKTVLVLGAGASKPFGFPTGIELSAKVVDFLNPGLKQFEALRAFGFREGDILAFREAFYFSGKNSLDGFLEHNPIFVEIGKAAIAAALVPCETISALFGYKKNWLRHLYNNLNTSFESFGKNHLSVVTFNYDRTVETFFVTALQNTYGKTEAEAVQALSSLPIIHLHGQLGPPPWEAGGRQFDPDLDTWALNSSVRGIKIIHEDIADGRDKDFERAKGLIQNADQVFFMGFGYNQTNLERLDARSIPDGVAFGTSVGLGNQEQVWVREVTDNRIRLVAGDCLDMVREHISWE